MATNLSQLQITEISVVDDPANPDAVISIFKAKGGKMKDDEEKTDDEEAEGKEAEGDDKNGKKPFPFAKLATAVLNAMEDASPDIIEKALSAGYADNPDAAAAAAAIFQEIVMGGETVAKTLDQANAEIAVLTKRATIAEAALSAEIAKGKSPADSDAELDESVLKSLPSAVRKQLEDGKEARVALAKAQADAAAVAAAADMAVAITKAKDLKLAEPEKAGAALDRIRKGTSTAADADLIEGMFRAAAAQSTTAALFKAIGSSDAPNDGEPETILKSKAAEIRSANPALSEAAAYSMALTQNPDVYDQYIAKRRASAV